MYGNSQRGFSLIELVIVIAIAGVLAALAIPAFTTMIANSRVRNAAEGMLNGMQIARAEAVRQNAPITLAILPDGISWDVIALNATYNAGTDLWVPRAFQTRRAEVGANISAPVIRNVTPDATNGTYNVTFNSLGRVSSPSLAQPNVVAIRYASPAGGSRAMCAVILSNTPRLCDPQRGDSTDPQACFFADLSPVTACN
jgi:type IV fimbrial biogenesis protein FimT